MLLSWSAVPPGSGAEASVQVPQFQCSASLRIVPTPPFKAAIVSDGRQQLLAEVQVAASSWLLASVTARWGEGRSCLLSGTSSHTWHPRVDGQSALDIFVRGA
jgi:hypothetical protein